jgi:uncharacterized protein YndB with AHSA1/START domain
MTLATDNTSFSVCRVMFEIPIRAPRDRVWQALTTQAEAWWPRTFCANPARAKAFHLELKLGGRLYEDWGNGDGNVWWTIYKLDAANFTFACSGDFQSAVGIDQVEFSVEESAGGATLKIVENLWGAVGDEKSLRDQMTAGWTELFDKAFRPFVENPSR